MTEGNRQEEVDLWSSSRKIAKARWYTKQKVDHFGDSESTWSQRYFKNDEYFDGPGHPIFVIIGGEDEVAGCVYPYIFEHLAKSFKAITFRVEHRFYGPSLPVKDPTNDQLQKLLSPTQALADIVQFIKHKQKELGCSTHRSSKHYCPIMTVGGSYPGFLAVLMRLVHEDLVDIGYGGSAPLHLYSHDVDSRAYYEKVTDVADEASPGCSAAVRSTQLSIQDKMISLSVKEAAHNLGICVDTIPDYITSSKTLLEEVVMIIATHFADDNMGYYPPSLETDLGLHCRIFQYNQWTDFEKVSRFLRNGDEDCFDLQTELPIGPHGRISASDWSGVGSGPASLPWDYQSCQLIPECGFSDRSMFLPRQWTLQWLTQHCQRRFDYTPVMMELVDDFSFDNLTGVSHVLFTNGLRDGWSVASILEPPPDSFIKVLNFENGAHHSDLTWAGPTDGDTPDIKAGHVTIHNIVKEWLKEVKDEYRREE
jgi:hypothetical protein